jgi:predicted nucleic acid-binding protein
MKLVLDASMALSWIFERADKKEATCSEEALAVLPHAEIYVPALWHTEITNALLVGERRKLITEAQAIDYLHKISHLPIVTDEILIANRREIIMALARKYGLTTYDATYLDLALRHEAILATFDLPLANAMTRAGGKVFGSELL